MALRAENGRLLYHPRELVTPDLQAEMQFRKAEILGLLTWPAEASEGRFQQLGQHHLSAGQSVSTPSGRGRSVAVLPEFVAVKMFGDAQGLSYFLPCEVSSQHHDPGEASREQ
ncbi:MAG: hypothetical protein HC897_02900 [Thermoanaerobaculia bacterium]|nr:hypothetical protein [Thermoanaerobaculia bacterium]